MCLHPQFYFVYLFIYIHVFVVRFVSFVLACVCRCVYCVSDWLSVYPCCESRVLCAVLKILSRSSFNICNNEPRISFLSVIVIANGTFRTSSPFYWKRYLCMSVCVWFLLYIMRICNRLTRRTHKLIFVIPCEALIDLLFSWVSLASWNMWFICAQDDMFSVHSLIYLIASTSKTGFQTPTKKLTRLHSG